MKTKLESNFFSTLKREKQELQITNLLFYNYFYHMKDKTEDKARIDGGVNMVKNDLEQGLNYSTVFLRGPAAFQMRYYLLSLL